MAQRPPAGAVNQRRVRETGRLVPYGVVLHYNPRSKSAIPDEGYRLVRSQDSCSPIRLAHLRTVPGEHIIHRPGRQLKVVGDENTVPPPRPAAELPHGTPAFCHAVREVREAAVSGCVGEIRLGRQGQ
jgi:hypothetical protein